MFFEIHWSKDFLFSAKSVKIAVIEPGLALAKKGHQVTVVCPIKAKKEVGYGESLGGFYEQHFFEEGKIYCAQTESKSEIYLQNLFVERWRTSEK